MKKQEFIQLHGLIEETARDYAEHQYDVVKQYLEQEKDVDTSTAPYTDTEDDQLLLTYFAEAFDTQYQDVHRGKTDHRAALLRKLDELTDIIAYGDPYLEPDADLTADEELLTSSDD